MAKNTVKVSISIYGKTRGSAHFAVKDTCEIYGSHMSPDNPPFVHEENDTISKEMKGFIFQQAEKLLSQGLDENCTIDASTAENISITDCDGTMHCYQKIHGQQIVNTEFEALSDLLKKHSIGW